MNYDRILLELMDRIAVLEDEVRELKKDREQGDVKYKDIPEETITFGKSKDSAGRDTTKFILDGKKYGKNRLVLAIVQKYMKMYPNTTAAQLMMTFDKSLQGSLGVVRTFEDVKENCSDYKTRFFTLPNELIRTQTDVCAVCTQWGISNIGNIIAVAEQLGIQIQIIK